MLFFGHEGITLGAATLVAGALNRRGANGIVKRPWFAALTNYIDVRMLAVGALLPDIIDKPLGIYILKIQNGRIYAHTLLFLLIIGGAGYYLYKSRKQAWLLTLAAGTLTHLVFDEMWQVPSTLFWPLFGWGFPRYELGDYIMSLLKEIFTNRYFFTTELIGLIIVIWFIVWLLYRHKFGTFIMRGKISQS